MLNYSTVKSARRRPTTSPACTQKKEYNSASAVQTKLTIGRPNDKYEQEADRVADQVVSAKPAAAENTGRMPVATIQSKPRLQKMDEEEVQAKPFPSIMRMPKEELQTRIQKSENQEIQTKASGNTSQVVSPNVQSQIEQSKGGGSPLSSSTRSFMESRIGADFSSVRIHNDSNAHKLNAKLNAQAFAVGNNVFFNQGKYNPESQSGKHLLAHELTHTVQQGASGKIATSHTGMQLKPITVKHMPNQQIQRATSWKPGVVHETINAATRFVKPNSPSPETLEVINNQIIRKYVDAISAINKPLIKVTGSGNHWEAEVTSVPLNVGSYDQTVISKGPWKTTVLKSQLVGRRAFKNCKRAGKIAIQIQGDPSDKDFYQANKRHEDRHAKDQEKAFKAIIVPWDIRLTIAKQKSLKYSGKSAAMAESQLWAAMGGKDSKVVKDFIKLSTAYGAVYHSTNRGRRTQYRFPQINSNCSKAIIKAINPS